MRRVWNVLKRRNINNIDALYELISFVYVVPRIRLFTYANSFI